MDPEDRVGHLLAQAKLADVDTRVDALAKLQQLFEASTTITHIDHVLQVLKPCLRTSNTHLYTAAMAAFSPLLQNIVEITSSTPDGTLLRQLTVILLPPGGVIDRLGEQREKPREKASEILFTLGSLCLKHGSQTANQGKGREPQKAGETPLAHYERMLCEVGLGSKLWRVREQSILVIASVRRENQNFPLRPFVPSLVHSLQDTDGTVRECARRIVIETFKGPTVTDAAKADLKKEMEKQGVRKTISEDVLSSVLSVAQNKQLDDAGQSDMISDASLTHITSKHPTERPLSVPIGASVPAPVPEQDIRPVFIASPKDLEQEFSRILVYFEGKETEHNWANREQSIARLRGMLKGGVFERYSQTFILSLKSGLLEGTLKALFSLRTTLASQCCALCTELASTLGTSLEPVVEILFSRLISMAGFTKKIIASQSQAAITTIMARTACPPRLMVPTLSSLLQDKNIQTRTYAMQHIKSYLDFHALNFKQQLESSGFLDVLEKTTHRALTDSSPAVRESARACFWSLHALWPDRATEILAKLDAATQKLLQKASPNPRTGDSSLPPPPPTKRSSVAAAIAASKAKARQIAVAPPSLRHQATSTSHFTHANVIGSSDVKHVETGLPNVLSQKKRAISQQRRTPSTTTLPVSREGSFRGTPSPPLSQHSSHNGDHPSKKSSYHIPTSPPRVPKRNSPRASLKANNSGDHIQGNSGGMTLALSAGERAPVTASNKLQSSPHLFDLISFSSPDADRNHLPMDSTDIITEAVDPEPAIEEELRATSAQAEAAAEQLLDLSGVLPSGRGTVTESPRLSGKSDDRLETPSRPSATIWSRVQAFQDSPRPDRSPNPLATLTNPKHRTSWWLKMKALNSDSADIPGEQAPAIDDLIKAVMDGTADARQMRTLIRLCRMEGTSNAGEPHILSGTLAEQLLDALMQYLSRAEASLNLETGLVLLWEVVENHFEWLNGHEMQVYQILFRTRSLDDRSLSEACSAIRDNLGARMDPIYGLTTLHSCLRDFVQIVQAETSLAAAYVFGLNGMGKFILRLPPEVLEEELPRMRPLLLENLSNANSVVRSAGSMVVVAAQLVLRDQAHLFALLDGLTEEKKNFLTYMFDKNQVHASYDGRDNPFHTTVHKVAGEMDKLEQRSYKR